MRRKCMQTQIQLLLVTAYFIIIDMSPFYGNYIPLRKFFISLIIKPSGFLLCSSVITMAHKEALNQQLLDIITSMEEEGLVDSHFRMVHSLKETNGPFFFAELIPTFCADAQTTIREMTIALEQPVLNYYDLEELCMKIKGGTSCIGAHQIALACGDLRRAIDDRSKDRCAVVVDAIRHEFLKLQSKMDIILQLERRIISHD